MFEINTQFEIFWKGQIRTIKISHVDWKYRHAYSTDWRYASIKDDYYTLVIEKKSKKGKFRKFKSNVSEYKLRKLLLKRGVNISLEELD